MTTETPTFRYDPFAQAVVDDPYPFYRVLRDAHPAYHVEERDCWTLSRYEDVQAAARDWATFSSASGIELDEARTLSREIMGPGVFIASDPPDHDRMRKVVHAYFTPKAIASLEERVRTRVRGLVRDLRERGAVDLATDFGWRLPVQLVSELLGLPPADEQLLQQAIFTLQARGEDLYEMPDEARATTQRLADYLDEQIAAKRAWPDDALLSVLVAAADVGTLHARELRGMAFILLLAATDTTASLLTNSLTHLEHRDDDRRRMVETPEVLPACVEELVRYDAPVQGLARVTTRAVELHGRKIPADAWVWLLFASANRDERRFERPDELDFSRPQQRHLGFGEGIHHCLGAPLARLEARVGLGELFSAVPEYELRPGAERLRQHPTRGWVKLPAQVAWVGSG